MATRNYPLRQERHGLRYRPEYQVWLQMKQRCLNPKNKRYPLYGARGITIHPDWIKSFAAFLKDVGERPGKNMTLERKNNEKGYEPGNVEWVTIHVQARNKRNNVWLTHGGRTMILADWAKELGMDKGVLRARLKEYGWTVERALTTPLNSPRKTSRMLTHRGRTQPMADWAREMQMNYKTLKNRINNLGWSVERALTTPAR